MKRILLPTDFSSISLNAIDYAISMFKDSKCEFYLLNVYRVPYMTNEELMENDAQQLAILEAEMYESSQKNLKKLVSGFDKNENHAHHTVSDYNFFVNSVKQIVTDKGIDLVVMGTKGATGAKEIFLGSNTGDVLMKTDCNVIAVPENSVYKAPKEIVFPTDFKLRYEREDLAPLIELADIKPVCVANSSFQPGRPVDRRAGEQQKDSGVLFGNGGAYFPHPDEHRLRRGLELFCPEPGERRYDRHDRRALQFFSKAFLQAESHGAELPYQDTPLRAPSQGIESQNSHYGHIYFFSQVLGLVHDTLLRPVHALPEEDQAVVRLCKG